MEQRIMVRGLHIFYKQQKSFKQYNNNAKDDTMVKSFQQRQASARRHGDRVAGQHGLLRGVCRHRRGQRIRVKG